MFCKDLAGSESILYIIIEMSIGDNAASLSCIVTYYLRKRNYNDSAAQIEAGKFKNMTKNIGLNEMKMVPLI